MNRYYDPDTGRYITADPIGLAGGVNLFLYTSNNPVNFIDPWGLCPEQRWWEYVIDGVSYVLIGADLILGGPSGEGIVPAVLIQGLKVTGKKAAKEVAKQATKKASQQGAALVKQYKGEGLGAIAKSGSHGVPLKRAGAQLIRDANKLPKNDPLRNALKKEGKRLVNKGKSINEKI